MHGIEQEEEDDDGEAEPRDRAPRAPRAQAGAKERPATGRGGRAQRPEQRRGRRRRLSRPADGAVQRRRPGHGDGSAGHDRTEPGEPQMATRRPTQSEIAAAKKVERQDEMDAAIASGRLVVRQMTPEERAESDARRAAAQARKGKGKGGARAKPKAR